MSSNSRRQPLHPDLHDKLVAAEKSFESGHLSRREFHKLLALIVASSGLTLAQASPAFAWLATRMRKGARPPEAGSSAVSSCRFSAARSCYLQRTPSSAGNRRTWTFSAWVKKAGKATGQGLLVGGTSASDAGLSGIWIGDDLRVGGYNTNWRITNHLLRDFSAWYHVVVAFDTTQSTANDRIRIYLNGELVTSFATVNNPSQNTDYGINQAAIHRLGYQSASAGINYFDGLLSEVCFIDGLTLTAEAFGQTNATTGLWERKQYTGSFGTNGFYLPFKSNSAVDGSGAASGGYPNVTGVSGLGADFSGNNHHWAGSGLAVTDRLSDSAANNFCSFNVIHNAWNSTAAYPTYSEGALQALAHNTTDQVLASGTICIPVSSGGKFYYEATCVLAGTTASNCFFGSESSSGGFVYAIDGRIYNGGWQNYGASYTTGDTIGVAIDLDAQEMTFYKNGVSQGLAYSNIGSLTTTPVTPYASTFGTTGSGWLLNCGQGGQSGLTDFTAAGGAFKYAPPSGFKALSTVQLSTPAVVRPSMYFAASTYAGNGGTRRIGEVIPSTQTYPVTRSLRFNAADTARLERTPASAGNRRTWTFSAWVKKTGLSNQRLFTAYSGNDASGYFDVSWQSDDTLIVAFWSTYYLTTSAVFRDPSRWIHVCVAMDTTQGTASERVKIFVDGQQVTAFAGGSSYPAQNLDTAVNNSVTHQIGKAVWNSGAGYQFDGYLAEIHLIDGQQLAPASFGQTDATSGEWVPKQYSGAHGSNGFYLNFSDNSNTTSATLGKDSSGNDNDWTPSGFSVAAGSGNDSLTDSPSNTGSDSAGIGTNASGNYATWNPLFKSPSLALSTLRNGNLDNTSHNNWYAAAGSLSVRSGKWYYEYDLTSVTGQLVGLLGWIRADQSLADDVTSAPGFASMIGHYFRNDSGGGYQCWHFSSAVSVIIPGVNAQSTGLFMTAVDFDSGRVYVGKDGTWYNSSNPADGTGAFPLSGFNPGEFSFTPFIAAHGINGSVNFGQRPFAYAPPTGFKCLHTKNLPAVEAGAAPDSADLVWIKGRSGTTDHALYDSARGFSLDLVSNSTAAETSQPNGLLSTTKTGFVIGNLAKLNTSGATYAAWTWKKGAAPGFDVVTYSGNGTARTIAHNLGAVPKMIIVKSRTNGSRSWAVSHSDLDSPGHVLYLNDSMAQYYNAANPWNSTAPTASVFTVGGTSGHHEVNESGHDFVAYLWSEVPGFSRFGRYTGNGNADGPFVWCGFSPSFVLIKRINAAESWEVFDGARDPRNPTRQLLYAHSNSSEFNLTAGNYRLDMLSNGFKIRTSNTGVNASGGIFVYVAFAHAPHKYGLAK